MSKEQLYKDYLRDHINFVREAYNKLKEYFPEYSLCDIDILFHDQSKYEKEEFIPYMNYFYGNKTPQIKDSFKYAWNHHQKNNPHHWQYYVLINDEEGIEYLDMPIEHIIEMICDWWSFSLKQNNPKEIFSWYKKHSNNILLSSTTRKEVEYILSKLENKLDEEELNNE